nr:MAG: capsid protein [Mamastrovirus 3]
MLRSALPRSRMGKPYRDSLMSSWIVFGGEDQRQALMANRQQKSQPRTTTKIVVRNGAAANQAGPSRTGQARRRRNRRKPQVNIRVLANQNKNFRRLPRRQGIGSRVVFQKINSTLGTVGSNGSEQIECELTCLLNPATMKEATGSNSFTPLSIYASTYSLFRMTKCTLVLKPLIGDNAVSGTVCRASWNPTSTPTQASWSSLGARKHIDVTPGKTARFTLTSRDLVGPKGGWFKTNTNGDPMMSFAGTIEIHTLGKTMSTYRGSEFSGGLFLVEMETHWQFKDYAQQPGMLNLVKGDDTKNARVETTRDGKLQLVLPGTSRMARASRNATSDIIWLVTDTIIQTGSTFLGPFGWLLRGGWWLVKRAAGAPVRTDGGATFDIYASISDARSNSPCITDQDVNVTVGNLHFQQLTPGNAGIDSGIPSGRSIDPDQATVTQCYVSGASMCKFGTGDLVPAACYWYNKNGGQLHRMGVGFKAGSEKVATFNIYKVTAHTDVGPIEPSMFQHQIPIILFADNEWPLGFAVASAYQRKETTGDTLWVSSILVYVTEARQHRYTGPWNITKVTYPDEDGGNYRVRVDTPSQKKTEQLVVNVSSGSWYVLQFVTQGVIEGHYMVGNQIIASKRAAAVGAGTIYYVPSVNDISNGLVPSYMSGLRLTPFTASEAVFSDSIHREAASSHIGGFAQDIGDIACGDIDPSFGCDDAFEFPPPPSEEDLADDEDEFEDPEDPEEDEDEDLELGPDDHYSDPPISRLVVRDDAFALYEQLRATHTERAARLAVNQLYPSDEYTVFTEVYHDALADGLSPRAARAHALGL